MGGMESCCQSQQDDKMLVTKMDLSHCSFTEVPNIVFNVERCIETLILSSNRITSLPPQLFHCQVKSFFINELLLSIFLNLVFASRSYDI